ncbi:hypothetical protein EDC04DRAFT_2613602 [Pisolithus marmoratus]|nr:hypothetical protein EDC04DRAFT_2613602 [Pisolithus marmoratus]
MIKLSPYQKAVKEASKYAVLPYLVPTPDVGSMAKWFMETLQKKQFLLTELAKTERAFEDYEIALCRYLSDTEVERLMKAHFVIQKPKTIEGKYMTVATELSMCNFCQSHELLSTNAQAVFLNQQPRGLPEISVGTGPNWICIQCNFILKCRTPKCSGILPIKVFSCNMVTRMYPKETEALLSNICIQQHSDKLDVCPETEGVLCNTTTLSPQLAKRHSVESRPDTTSPAPMPSVASPTLLVIATPTQFKYMIDEDCYLSHPHSSGLRWLSLWFAYDYQCISEVDDTGIGIADPSNVDQAHEIPKVQPAESTLQQHELLQGDELPLAQRRAWHTNHWLPLCFRDMLPEPPLLLPPTIDLPNSSVLSALQGNLAPSCDTLPAHAEKHTSSLHSSP